MNERGHHFKRDLPNELGSSAKQTDERKRFCGPHAANARISAYVSFYRYPSLLADSGTCFVGADVKRILSRNEQNGVLDSRFSIPNFAPISGAAVGGRTKWR